MLTKYLSFSFFKLYIFLFFLGAQSFLVFWISVAMFKFPPFGMFGFFMYLLTFMVEAVIQGGVKSISHKNMAPISKPEVFILPIFILFSIFVLVIYILAVNLMQDLVITHFGVPEELFTFISWSLNILSFILSFYVSFLTKQFHKQAP